jgi:predicted RNA-binding Zn ribbon-like protein
MQQLPVSARIAELHRQQQMSEATQWRRARQAEQRPARTGAGQPLLARIAASARDLVAGLTRRGLQANARRRVAPAATLLVPHRLNQ